MQNLINDLINTLKNDERLIIDGKLVKNKIVELALAMDEGLITLLLTNQPIKKHFFKNIGEVLVFDKVAFQSFVSNKQFLPDSYTAFKNKIGLTASSEYLTESKEVVLVWPYKDCVLEGGQTKEDQKRKEIFWNETLAPDEIDRLLAPKALGDFKKYDKDGEHKVDSISLDDNLIIRGNNLLALHSLKKEYSSEVQLIYIDPPFNTDNDSFLYNDSFTHSSWLTFMKNRLEVAKILLKNEGFIFINIDAIEEAYLKVLCDEIFGRNNFVNVITVKSSTPSGTKTAHKNKTIIKQKDLILVYRKSTSAILNPQYASREKWDKHYTLYLEGTSLKNFKLSKLIDVLHKNNIAKNTTSINKLDLNQKDFKAFYIKNSEQICRLQSHKNTLAKKRSIEAKDEIYEHIEHGVSKGLFYNGQVITPLKQSIRKVYKNKKFETDLGMLLCDFWADIDFQNTQNEGSVSFPNGKKPEALLSRIIELTTSEGDTILDYHLGSGTTSAVTLKANRKFIGIEQINYGENDAVNRLQKVINGEQSGMSKAYNWEGGGSFIYCELVQHNANIIEKIEKANTTKSLRVIFREIETSDFVSYKIKPETINENIYEFEALSLDEQKQFLIATLDKNQLYVNYSDIDDEDYQITEADKKLNKQFYGEL